MLILPPPLSLFSLPCSSVHHSLFICSKYLLQGIPSGIPLPSFMRNKPHMKKVLNVVMGMAVCCALHAQTANVEKIADESLDVAVGGTFGKSKIIPRLDKLAIAQASIYFKNITTREVVEHERGALGRRKTDGGSVAGRITAYLQITDGELTEADYQELADGFYSYLSAQLNAAGVSTVDWNTIAATDFHREEGKDLDDVKKDLDAMKKKGQVYTAVNANKGNVLFKYNIDGGINPGFAFGKIKKANRFSETVGAPVVFMHLTVDFADIWLDGDVRTGTKETRTSFYTKITKTKKWKMDSEVGADMKVTPAGLSMFWNEKAQTENLVVKQDIHSGEAFASAVSEDAEKEKLRAKDNIFAKDFNLTPVVISTTKAQYKAAAKKALEVYADAFVAKVKMSRKS